MKDTPEERRELLQKEKLDIKIDREWLIEEFGENHKLSEVLHQKLIERKERELLYLKKRRKEQELKQLERKKFEDYKSKLDEPNYLNSHPWMHVNPPQILARIAEWIAAKIALKKPKKKSK